jgi:hypothetical protein
MVERTVRVFGGARIDTTDWPLVLQDLPEEPVLGPAATEMFAYIEKVMRETFAAGEKSFHVVDLTRARTMADASGRKQAADFVTRNYGLAQATSLGTAFVAPSAFARGLLTAIFWLTDPPVPQAFFAARDDAYRHAVRTLEAGGVALPPRLLELRDSARVPPPST